MVEGMLPESVLCGLAVEAVFPAGVVKYGGGDLGAARGVDEEGADRVGAVVHSDDVMRFLHMACLRIPVKITFNFLVCKKKIGFGGAGRRKRGIGGKVGKKRQAAGRAFFLQ